MLQKVIVLGLILLLVMATVVLQMAVFGNYEEMVEEEYEEFQIRIDYDKMVAAIRGLLGQSEGPRNTQANGKEEKKRENQETDSADEAVTSFLKAAPTAPTVPTLE